MSYSNCVFVSGDDDRLVTYDPRFKSAPAELRAEVCQWINANFLNVSGFYDHDNSDGVSLAFATAEDAEAFRDHWMRVDA